VACWSSKLRDAMTQGATGACCEYAEHEQCLGFVTGQVVDSLCQQAVRRSFSEETIYCCPQLAVIFYDTFNGSIAFDREAFQP